MDLTTLKAWLTKNKTAALGTAGVGVAGAALYAKHKSSATTSGTVTPATTDAATVAADQGLTGTVPTYGGDTGGGSGMDSVISSDLDAQVTALQNLLDAQTTTQTTLGQIGSTLTTIAQGAGGGGSSSTSAGGSSKAGGTRSSSKYTTAAQTDQYVVEYDKANNTYYDVTTKGTVHKLTPAQLAADLKSGATAVSVGARPMPAAAKRPAPKPAPPKAKPRVKKK